MREPSLAVGYKVDKLLILSESYRTNNGKRFLWFEVRCDCGTEFEASNNGLRDLAKGRRKHAECRKCSAARYRNAKLGQVFGKLTVTGFTETKPCRAICLCECGNVCNKVIRNLEYTSGANCGCVDGRTKSETRIGSRFGKLTVTAIHRKALSKRKTSYNFDAECICDCGKVKTYTIGNLLKKKENSGCVWCSRETPDKWIATMKSAIAQGTSKRQYLNWTLNVDQYKLLATSNCHYCGELPRNKGRYFTVNGIDRVDSNIGYVDGNCVSCCSMCNRAKGKHDYEFFKSWIVKAYKYQNE